MLTYYEDKEKGKRYDLYPVCPKCRGEVYWRSYNTTLEDEEKYGGIHEVIVAHCENSNLAYRSIQNTYDKSMCDWRGKVSRNKNGNLFIINFNETPVPYRIYISDIDNDTVDYIS
jgi:hypothetical protein